MANQTHPTAAVITITQLAELLQVSPHMAQAVATHHGLPHVTIAGEPRWVTAQVLGWLQHMASSLGGELLPPEESADVTPKGLVITVMHALPPVQPGEHAWIDSEVTTALAEGSADAGRNLDRLKIRDALLEINDELLPLLTRLSDGRLHPDPNERSRTSPWRLDLDADGAITAMSIAWGSGQSAAPQFADQPRLQVELTHGVLRVSLETEGATLRVAPAELDSLGKSGLAVDVADVGHDMVGLHGVARIYTVPSEGVSIVVVCEALTADVERLVPLWCRVA